MENNTLGVIIGLSSFTSILLLCGCIRIYTNIYGDKHEKDRLNNTRRKLMASKRIKPINLTIIDEEIKSKSEIREVEENV